MIKGKVESLITQALYWPATQTLGAGIHHSAVSFATQQLLMLLLLYMPYLSNAIFIFMLYGSADALTLLKVEFKINIHVYSLELFLS